LQVAMCKLAMASYQLATARLQAIPTQARYSESPARHGEIIGPNLTQLAVTSRSSPWRVSSAQNPVRHERSPITRCGELMQRIPCFV
jgi:hypothetical protein